jgi:hypothetical protein
MSNQTSLKNMPAFHSSLNYDFQGKASRETGLFGDQPIPDIL